MEKKREKTFQKYILFTAYGEGLPIAWHLQLEGKDVVVGQVDDLLTIGCKKPESAEKYRRRWSAYSNMLNKQKAEKLIEKMEKIPNKDDYFVIFDFNTLYPYADKARKMGFTHGLFPTKFDYMLENDRSFAKSFVQSQYPDLKVAEMSEFKTIEEGIEFVQQSEEFWALKGNDPDAGTVVPITKMVEFGREEIIDALRSHKEDYERGGFILERQIRDGVEFCFEQIYYDGNLVATTVDIENKAIGPGNVGIKTGCIQNLVCEVPNDAGILSKLFPEAIQKLAKKHTGVFYADVNTILKDGELYYLEHCGNRFSFDATVTEIEMAGSASNYFEAIANGENPFENKFGVAVRGMNFHRDADNNIMEDINMKWKDEFLPHIHPFEIRKDDEGHHVNTGSAPDLVVFTAASDDIEYAIIKTYEIIENFSFDELYTRSQGDFTDRTYYGNILDRYDAVEKFISKTNE